MSHLRWHRGEIELFLNAYFGKTLFIILKKLVRTEARSRETLDRELASPRRALCAHILFDYPYHVNICFYVGILCQALFLIEVLHFSFRLLQINLSATRSGNVVFARMGYYLARRSKGIIAAGATSISFLPAGMSVGLCK